MRDSPLLCQLKASPSQPSPRTSQASGLYAQSWKLHAEAEIADRIASAQIS